MPSYTISKTNVATKENMSQSSGTTQWEASLAFIELNAPFVQGVPIPPPGSL